MFVKDEEVQTPKKFGESSISPPPKRCDVGTCFKAANKRGAQRRYKGEQNMSALLLNTLCDIRNVASDITSTITGIVTCNISNKAGQKF
jgi:hypothetical protein